MSLICTLEYLQINQLCFLYCYKLDTLLWTPDNMNEDNGKNMLNVTPCLLFQTETA